MALLLTGIANLLGALDWNGSGMHANFLEHHKLENRVAKKLTIRSAKLVCGCRVLRFTVHIMNTFNR